jgi:hypothetical protein
MQDMVISNHFQHDPPTETPQGVERSKNGAKSVASLPLFEVACVITTVGTAASKGGISDALFDITPTVFRIRVTILATESAVYHRGRAKRSEDIRSSGPELIPS